MLKLLQEHVDIVVFETVTLSGLARRSARSVRLQCARARWASVRSTVAEASEVFVWNSAEERSLSTETGRSRQWPMTRG